MNINEEFKKDLLQKVTANLKLHNRNTPRNLGEVINFVVDRGIVLQAEEEIDAKKELSLVMFDVNPNSATSRKVKNIKLNLIQLLESLSQFSITIVGSRYLPILGILSFLIAIRAAYRAATVDLNSDDAIILYSMWKVKLNGKVLKVENIEQAAKKEFKKYGRKKPTLEIIEKCLNNLSKIGCIIFMDKENKYKLIESIQFKVG